MKKQFGIRFSDQTQILAKNLIDHAYGNYGSFTQEHFESFLESLATDMQQDDYDLLNMPHENIAKTMLSALQNIYIKEPYLIDYLKENPHHFENGFLYFMDGLPEIEEEPEDTPQKYMRLMEMP